MQGWAIVELLGGVAMAGKVSEERHFGGVLGRIDTPNGDGFLTQYFGVAGICRITPVEEAVARDFASGGQQDFIYKWPACGGCLVYSEEFYEDREFDDGGEDDDVPF